MTKFTLDVLIKGSTNMTKVAGTFKKSTGKINKAIKGVNASAAANKVAFQKSAVAVDRLSRVLAIGLVAAFTAATVAGASFEVAIADLSALTGITGRSLEDLSTAALGMSTQYGVSASKVAESTKLVASAKSELIGVSGALETVTENAIILSKASRTDLAVSTKVLTTSMNQFNLGAEEASRVINVLAVGAKLGASEIRDTGQAILRAGVAARVAGVSFEETQAAIQVLAKGGLKGVIAGTQMKTMLLRMMASTDLINPKIVGLQQAFENLSKAQLTGSQYSKLFGLEAMTAGIIITENKDLLKKWSKEFKGTNIAQEQATRNMQSLTEAGKRLASSIAIHLIAAFNSYGPALTKIADATSQFLQDLRDPPSIEFIRKMTAIKIAIITVTAALALLLIEFNIWRAIQWARLIGPALASIWSLNTALMAGLVSSLGAVIAASWSFISFAVPSMISGLAATATAAWSLAAAVFAATWPILAIVAVIALVVGVVALAVVYWDSFGAAITLAMGPLGMLVATVMAFKEHWSFIIDSFKGGGIKAGILAIGKVMASSILKPIEQMLRLASKIPGMGGLGSMADKLHEFQSGMFDEESNIPLSEQAADASRPVAAPVSRQELDVNMKIDAEGRPTIETVESKGGNLTFNTTLGFSNAHAGVFL